MSEAIENEPGSLDFKFHVFMAEFYGVLGERSKGFGLISILMYKGGKCSSRTVKPGGNYVFIFYVIKAFTYMDLWESPRCHCKTQRVK